MLPLAYEIEIQMTTLEICAWDRLHPVMKGDLEPPRHWINRTAALPRE